MALPFARLWHGFAAISVGWVQAASNVEKYAACAPHTR